MTLFYKVKFDEKLIGNPRNRQQTKTPKAQKNITNIKSELVHVLGSVVQVSLATNHPLIHFLICHSYLRHTRHV